MKHVARPVTYSFINVDYPVPEDVHTGVEVPVLYFAVPWTSPLPVTQRESRPASRGVVEVAVGGDVEKDLLHVSRQQYSPHFRSDSFSDSMVFI
jgi:hypothetical protein